MLKTVFSRQKRGHKRMMETHRKFYSDPKGLGIATKNPLEVLSLNLTQVMNSQEIIVILN
jgi:hypothetical protein